MIQVPPARGVRNATYEVRQKDAMDWPMATASVALQMQGSSVGKATIVLGHVVEKPKTIATAIRIGNPASWAQAVKAVQESNGKIDLVTGNMTASTERELGITIWKNLGPKGKTP